MSSTKSSIETQVEKNRYSKDVPWYHKDIQDFSPAAREILEKYSHIRPEEVDSHVFEMRERAWAIQPYPCIGGFKFLYLSISIQPCYPRILSFLKEPQSRHTLLDLGCCFAQDIRKLVHDGVPSENLYACDLEQSFLDLSYDLFRDRDTMKGHFFTANALDETGPLDELQGKIDIIYAASFLHLFGWDDQLKLCKKMIKTLRPRKGSTVFGRQVGNVKAQEVRKEVNIDADRPALWRHDVASFENLWELAGGETGTRWETWAMLDVGEGMGPGHWGEEGLRRLRFEVVRVE